MLAPAAVQRRLPRDKERSLGLWKCVAGWETTNLADTIIIQVDRDDLLSPAKTRTSQRKKLASILFNIWKDCYYKLKKDHYVLIKYYVLGSPKLIIAQRVIIRYGTVRYGTVRYSMEDLFLYKLKKDHTILIKYYVLG